MMTVDDVAAFYNVPREKLGYYERAVFDYNEDLKNAEISFIPTKLPSKYTPIIMDLKAKIEELNNQYEGLVFEKKRIHEYMKEIKKKISKYETVLKHAEEIEQLNEPVGEKTVL